MAENVPNSGRGTNIQVQEIQRVPNKKHPKRHTPRHIKIKMVKVKEKEDPKSSKRKTTCYVQGKYNLLCTNGCQQIFIRNFTGQREWHDIFKVSKEKKIQLPTKNSLSNKVIIQNWRIYQEFPIEQKLREFITTKPALLEILMRHF